LNRDCAHDGLHLNSPWSIFPEIYRANANPAAVVEYRLSWASQVGGKSTQRGASRKAGFVGKASSRSTELILLRFLTGLSLKMEVDGIKTFNGSSSPSTSGRDRLRIRLNSRNKVGYSERKIAVRMFFSNGLRSVLSMFEMDFLDSFLRNDIVSGTHNESPF
jgi:hypothetical protein